MADEKAQRSLQLEGAGHRGCLAREILDRLATPHLRDRIFAAALLDAGLSVVPEEPAGFRLFASGPLRDAIDRALGEDAAVAVLTDLSAAIGEDVSVGSGVRRRSGASLPPPRHDAPIVLVASESAAHVDALVSRVKDHAKVIAAYDVFALLTAASRHLSAPLTLLLDSAMPALRPGMLATLARVLPPKTRIIVWGAGPLEPDPPTEGPIEWVWLGPVGDVASVADVCLAMWSEGSRGTRGHASTERRVVLAHDDAGFRARVGRILSEAGYVVLSAPDGFMALERCIDESPSAVVAALRMATLDGAQLAALLRSRFRDDAPPVLLVADGPLPEPPSGVMAMIRTDAVGDELVPELAAWASGAVHADD